MSVPRIAFVNKMDRVGANYRALHADDGGPSAHQAGAGGDSLGKAEDNFVGVIDVVAPHVPLRYNRR